jgi:hypothetical protein
MLHALAPISLCLLALAGPLAQQEQPDAHGRQPGHAAYLRPPEGPPLLSQADLKIQYYTPANLDAYELADIVGGMVGRTFYLTERGGYTGDPIDNMTIVGDMMLLYDTPEYLGRMLETLAAVDQPVEREQRAPADPWVTFHYTPRYLSMSDLYSIAEGLSSNLSMAGERRILVVQDNASTIAELEELLREVDVPEDQVLVTAYLVRGRRTGEQGPPLPVDLAEHLGRLVPGLELEVAGFAMLQSAAVPRGGQALRLRLSGSGPEEDYYLSFAPTAYDRETGSLSVERCELEQSTSAGHVTVFSTNTVFRGAEYTVLGATGANPVFVVIRLSRV